MRLRRPRCGPCVPAGAPPTKKNAANWSMRMRPSDSRRKRLKDLPRSVKNESRAGSRRRSGKRRRRMPHIEISGVSLAYDTPAGRVEGVHEAHFAIEQSEFLCLVGPSGCGKSTLLNIIAGFLTPTSGEITIAGKNVNGNGMDRGVVFQDFAQLFPWRTALGNVSFGLEVKGVPHEEPGKLAPEQLRLG